MWPTSTTIALDPRAYHFYTNVLEVNKQIHTEAKKLLCEGNIFPVIN